MSWYEEQIKDRKRMDEAELEETLRNIAESVMGKGGLRVTEDKRIQAQSALGEILRYYHVKGRDIPSSMTEVDEILSFELRPHGIMSRNVRLTAGWSKKASGPMFAQLRESGDFIALIPKTVYGYKYFDPRLGKWISVKKKNEKAILEDAMVFYKPFPRDKKGISCLASFMIENVEKRDLVCYFIFMFIATTIGLRSVDIYAQMISAVAESGSRFIKNAETAGFAEALLLFVSVYMVSLIIGKILYEAFSNLILKRVEIKLEQSVSAASMIRLLSLPPSFFTRYSSGELAVRLENVSSLMEMLVDGVFSMGFSSVFSLIYVRQIVTYAPSLLGPALLTVLASLCLTVLTVSVNLRISREKLALEAKESGMTYALISGVRKIKTTGAEKRAFTRWGELYRKKAELEFDPPTFVKINGTLSMAIGLIGTMAMYFFAVKNNIDPDEYYAFNTAYGMVNSAFGALAGIAVTIANIRPVFEMARPILDSEREVDEERPPVERLSGAVELNNVTFSYTENGPKVLDDLSLKITAGQYVAVVGETGCGKSTLMKLLLGFEQPIRGSVYYDGRDLRTLDVRSVRQKIGVVTQGGKLFAGDIYSNIVISAPMLSLEDAWEAAEMAGMADDIRHMPMGMHTLISEGQGGISGGQKQRLMIARAIAPKPRILMFDEATSALDNITQKKVSESLDRLKCTRIVIAHRLSTIKNCDRIVVMQGGKIVEDGTYEELMQKNGFFAELVKRQIA